MGNVTAALETSLAVLVKRRVTIRLSASEWSNLRTIVIKKNLFEDKPGNKIAAHGDSKK